MPIDRSFWLKSGETDSSHVPRAGWISSSAKSSDADDGLLTDTPAPLREWLCLSDGDVAAIERLSIHDLDLTVRASTCLKKNNVRTVGELLSLTLADLFQIRNMGRKSVDDVMACIRRAVAHAQDAPSDVAGRSLRSLHCAQPAADGRRGVVPFGAVFYPATIGDDWDLFSWGAPRVDDLADWPLSSSTREALHSAAVATADVLFPLTAAELPELIGDAAATQLLDALLDRAVAQRTQRVVRDVRDETALRKTLEGRWSSEPIRRLGFSAGSLRLLHRAGITSVSDLTGALDPLHRVLHFDLAAFLDIWNRLTAIGLRSGDGRDEWENLIARDQHMAALDDIMDEIDQVCTAAGCEVLARRYRLFWSPEARADSTEERFIRTLGAVSEKVLVTRERVRQMELRAVERLFKRIGLFASLCETLASLVAEAGGVVSIDAAGDMLRTRFRSNAVSPVGLACLLMEAYGKFCSVGGDVYRLETVPRDRYANVIRAAIDILKSASTFVTEDQLVCAVYRRLNSSHGECASTIPVGMPEDPETDIECLRNTLDWSESNGNCNDIGNLNKDGAVPINDDDQHCLCQVDLPKPGRGAGAELSIQAVRACLRAYGGFDEVEATRRGLNMLIAEALRRIGKPAHYSEVTNVLNASGWRSKFTTEKAVHARLTSVRELFVYVGPGTYGLAEWGIEDRRVFDRYKNGYIGDLIEEFLAQRDSPADTAEIVAFVLSRKRCQEFSVLQRLCYDNRFHAFGRARYGLKRWVT